MKPLSTLIKRLLIATGLGALLGIFCILGQAQRGPTTPLPNSTIYLLSAWYNRVIMGMMIGFAGEWFLIKNKVFINAILRGALLGLLVSASFGLLNQELEFMYFFAGIIWGILNDCITTWLIETKIKDKRKKVE